MIQKRFSFLAVAGIWLTAILVLFGFYQLVERYWLDWADMRVIRILHLVRGISASAVTTFLVGFYLVKRSPAASILGGVLSSPPTGKEETIRRRAVWFIHMRWIALILAASSVVIAYRLTNLLPRENFVPLMFGLLLLFALNIFYALRVLKTPQPYRFLIVQAVADLLILTFLLHVSGGIENPLYLIYLFHVMIAGIILSRRDAVFMTVLAALLFLGLVSLTPGIHAAHDSWFVAVRAIPFLMVIGFTGYFTILLRDQIRHDEAGILQQSKLAAIGELAGRIAHEINNPIGIISARAKLLLEDKDLSTKMISALEKIDTQSQRIAELTKGLLTFSRPSFGQKSPLDLGQIIDDTLNILEPTILGGEIRIEKKLAFSLSLIRGNTNEIQQILLNIINNARDAMPHGGVLGIETREGKDDHVELCVSDTGSGIPKHLIPRIFDPFFTTKEEGKGTGLGLSITHGLVRSHEGMIEVESEEEVGTVVTIRFPRLTPKEDPIRAER